MTIIKLLPLMCALIAGMAIASLFNSKTTAPAIELKPRELKKEAAATEQHYTVVADSFKLLSQNANQQLTNTRKELSALQGKNNRLQSEIRALSRKEILVTKTDTLRSLANCDSLRSFTALLLSNEEKKNSLYMELDNYCVLNLVLKDSIIHAEQDKYVALKLSFNQSTEQLEQAVSAMKSLNKQAKRRKIKNKLVALAIATASGIAAGMIVK